MSKFKDLTENQQEWESEVGINQPFAAGVEDQLHEVLHRIFDEFEERVEGPRMETFQKIWRETSFGLVFHGRESFRELYEFSEELFDMVKQFAVKTRKKVDNPDGLRYAALYLLYALYFKQPCRPKVKIRLTLNEFKEMINLVEDAKDGSHYDVVYAWVKLFSEAAFHYVAAPGHLGIELAYQLEQKEIRAKGPKKKSEHDFFSSGHFKRLMKNVTRSHEQYEKAKKQFIETNPESKKLFCLNGTEQDFPSTLLKIVEGEKSTKVNVEKDEDIGEKRRRIKEKFGDVRSYRDQLLEESNRRDNSLMDIDEHMQEEDDFPFKLDLLDLQETTDTMEQQDTEELDGIPTVDDGVPLRGKPRSKLRGRVRRRGTQPKRGGVQRGRGNHSNAALHEVDEDLSVGNSPVGGKGKKKRGGGVRGGRRRGVHHEGKVQEGGYGQDMGVHHGENVQEGGYGRDMLDLDGILEATTSSGRNSASACPGAQGNLKMKKGGLKCSGEQVGEVSEEQGGGQNQVGEKMEKAKVKRKNKFGMWGNAAIRNPPQDQQVEQEPQFRFNRNVDES